MQLRDVDRFARALWGGKDWGDAVVAASYQDRGKGFVTTPVPLAGCPGELASWAEKTAKPGRSLYVGVAPRRGGLPPGKRGGKEDLVGVPALWADIDCAEGEHAAPVEGRLPTLDEAYALLRERCPLPPSFVVRSGGGLHAYWLLLEPASPSDQVFHDWQRWWEALTRDTGIWVDRSAFDPARALRLPGSVNPKGGKEALVVLEADEEPRRWELGGIVSAFGLSSQARAEVGRQSAGKRVSDDDERAGSLLAREVPISEILTACFGWSETSRPDDRSTRWHVPGGTSGPEESQAESHVDEDGVERAWGYSPRAQEHLGTADQAPISSWELLAHICGGFPEAAMVAKEWASWPEEGRCQMLIDLLVSYHDDPQALLKQVGPSSVPTREITVREAFSSLPGVRFEVMPKVSVVIGGTKHGVWLETKTVDKEGEQKAVQEKILDWVAWRSKRVLRVLPSSAEPAKVSYQVEIVKANGARDVMEMDEDSSLSIAKIQSRSLLGLAIPEERGKKAMAARNCLALLGVDEREDSIIYTATGWVKRDDGAHMLAMPDGSVLADRADRSVVVEASGGLTKLGFSAIPSGAAARDAVKAVAGLLEISPRRRDIGVALVGALAAAPLRMPRRCSVMLVAPPDSGKSVLARCATAWLTASPTPPDATYSLKAPTVAGANAVIRWSRDIPIIADDFRRRNDARDTSVAAALQAIIGAGYQDISPARANVDGSLRQTVEPQTVPVITGEDTLDEEGATMSRAVALRVDKDDIDLGLNGPVQAYLDRYVATGWANKAYASYLAWVAKQLDTRGEWAPRDIADEALDALRLVSEGKRVAWYHKGRAARSREVVAPLAVGIDAVYAWAASLGAVSLLPPREELEGVLEGIAEERHKASESSSITNLVLAWIRSALEIGNAYIAPPAGSSSRTKLDQPPDDLAFSLGWRRSMRDGAWEHKPSALEIGVLSRDHAQVVITPGAWVDAARQCPDTKGLSARQVHTEVLRHFGLKEWARKRSISLVRGTVVDLSSLVLVDHRGDKPVADIVPLDVARKQRELSDAAPGATGATVGSADAPAVAAGGGTADLGTAVAAGGAPSVYDDDDLEDEGTPVKTWVDPKTGHRLRSDYQPTGDPEVDEPVVL